MRLPELRSEIWALIGTLAFVAAVGSCFLAYALWYNHRLLSIPTGIAAAEVEDLHGHPSKEFERGASFCQSGCGEGRATHCITYNGKLAVSAIVYLNEEDRVVCVRRGFHFSTS